MSGKPTCPYCGDWFLTVGGLKQHIMKKVECFQAQQREVMTEKAALKLMNLAAYEVQEKQHRTRASVRFEKAGGIDQKVPNSIQRPSEFDNSAATDWEPEVMDYNADDSDSDDDTSGDESFQPNVLASDSEDDTASYGVIVEEESFDSDNEEDVNQQPPNTGMMHQFKEYCSDHAHNFLPLTREYISSIKLLDILKRKKAALNSFEEVMEWHLKDSNELAAHETLKDTDRYFRR